MYFLSMAKPSIDLFQITVLAIIVTVIKIILFDTKNYPELFGRPPTTTDAPVTTTLTPL